MFSVLKRGKRAIGLSMLLAMAAPANGLAQEERGAGRVQGKAPATPIASVAWPRVAPAPDRKLEARIDAILARMTLEAKVGQIIQADINRVTPEEVRQYRLGSVLNGANSGPGKNDKAPAAEWLKLADRFYAASMDVPAGEPAIPVIWGTDAVHGHGNIIGATLFPHNIGLGAARDPELVRRIGQITAQEIVVTGLDWDFSPTLAVTRDDRWGRSYEAYSEDPEIVRAYAGPMVEGLQGKLGAPDFLGAGHVIATAKHYIGDGGTQNGRNQGDNLASAQALRDIHGAGYLPAIAAGVQGVMASHSSIHGVKMHANRQMLTDVLRDQIGFDGLVVGDWNGHGAVPGCSNTSCAPAINAGLDMFMAPDSWKGLYVNTLAQVRSGEIPMARLDEAVRRVLRVKMRAGLFDKGKPSSRPFAGQFDLLGSPEHRAVAREAVQKSLVLLKNNGGLLPLRRGLRVLVAGDGADNMSKQSGAWTISWQGAGITNADFPHGQTIFAGIQEAVAGAGSATLSPDGAFTEKPDVAIVVFGENPYAESEGDRDTLEYSPDDKKDLELLKRLRAANIPVVSVFLSGRPLWVNPELNASDAFVAAFLPGAEGGGISDVLFRKADGTVNHDFTGKLSFSWPRRADQYVLNRGDKGYDPLFAYGYGLTYAKRRTLGLLAETRPPIDPATRAIMVFPGGAGVSELVEAGQRTVYSGAAGKSAHGGLSVESVDRKVQEDARKLVWSGQGEASFQIVLPGPIDIADGKDLPRDLVLDYRVDAAPTGPMSLGMACAKACGGALPLANVLAASAPGQWLTLTVPMRCFAEAGVDLKAVASPLQLTASGRAGLSFSNIRIERERYPTKCPA